MLLAVGPSSEVEEECVPPTSEEAWWQTVGTWGLLACQLEHTVLEARKAQMLSLCQLPRHLEQNIKPEGSKGEFCASAGTATAF